MNADRTVSEAEKGFRELLVEAAEKGTTSSVQRKKKYLKLVESSNGDPILKKRLIRIGKVLDDWDLIKLHLFLTEEEVKYLESLELSLDETYFVQAGDRLQLDKFKSFFLLMDGTDLMPNVIDLDTLVSIDMGVEELSVEDIERGMSNINIIYIRKNMGLMGRGNDLYINKLLNHISFRRSKKRKTLILSEVVIRAIVDSGEVTPILITNDKLKTSTGKAVAIQTMSHVAPEYPEFVREDDPYAKHNSSNSWRDDRDSLAEKKAREQARANRDL